MYYGGLMSKGKYKAVCLSLAFKPKKGVEKRCRTKLTLGENGFQVPGFVPYDQLIKNIDMVALKDIKDFCDDLDIDDEDKLVSGRYRELGDILIRFASMYIKLEREMLSIFYGLGGRTTASVFLLVQMVPPLGKMKMHVHFLSFLNLGQRVASSAENFLLLGANCSETHPAMVKYVISS